MTPRPPAYDQRPMLWVTGLVLGLAGLAIVVMDNPLVPLSYVFHLVPLGLGGAVGTAILRERYGPRWMWAYAAFMLWFVFAATMDQTTPGIVFLSAGLYSLTRATLQTVAEMES